MWQQTKGIHVDLVDRFDYPLFKTVGPPYTMALTSKIIKVVKRSELDMIHSHYAIPHAMAAYMAREIINIPYVVTLHGSDVHTLGLDPAYKPVVKHTVEKANGVTAVSEFLKKKAHEELGIEREIHVIPNFIDTATFSQVSGIRLVVESGCVSLRGEEEAFEICPDDKIILHASNFRSVKRVVQLVEIMKIVVDANPNARLIIAGDGPTRIEVERKIEELKFVLLEAMSCKLPVLTTPAGGIPELVRPGKDGVVTKGYGKEEYAEELIKLLEDASKRKKLGQAGLDRVEDKFTAEKVVSMYEKVFEEATGK